MPTAVWRIPLAPVNTHALALSYGAYPSPSLCLRIVMLVVCPVVVLLFHSAAMKLLWCLVCLLFFQISYNLVTRFALSCTFILFRIFVFDVWWLLYALTFGRHKFRWARHIELKCRLLGIGRFVLQTTSCLSKANHTNWTLL